MEVNLGTQEALPLEPGTKLGPNCLRQNRIKAGARPIKAMYAIWYRGRNIFLLGFKAGIGVCYVVSGLVTSFWTVDIQEMILIERDIKLSIRKYSLRKFAK